MWILWISFAALFFTTQSVQLQLSSPVFALTLLVSLFYLRIPAARRSRAVNGLIAISACYLTAAGADLITRPFLADRLFYRAEERFLRRWPLHADLFRYKPRVSYEGQVHGDLAAMAQRPDWTEPRKVRFETDAFGFRNQPAQAGSPASLFILGDSLADGCGVSQTDTLAGALWSRHQQPVYNLSLICTGPQTEYINLVAEWPRLKVGPNPRVYWVLFTGNDLDDLAWSDPPEAIRWSNPWRRIWTAVENIRRRSVITAWLLRFHPATKGSKRQVLAVDFDGKPVLFYHPYAVEAQHTAEEMGARPEIRRVRAVIEAMGRWSREKNVEVVLLTLPSKEQVYAWVYQGKKPWSTPAVPTSFFQAIQDTAGGAGIKAYDLNAFLIKESRRLHGQTGELLWWRDDTHMNNRGHEALTRYILKLDAERPNLAAGQPVRIP